MRKRKYTVPYLRCNALAPCNCDCSYGSAAIAGTNEIDCDTGTGATIPRGIVCTPGNNPGIVLNAGFGCGTGNGDDCCASVIYRCDSGNAVSHYDTPYDIQICSGGNGAIG